MNRSTVAALVVALMLGAGIAGYLIAKPGDTLDRASTTTASTAKPAKTTTPVALPTPAAAPNEAFAYRRTGIDSSKPEGEACLFFNKPLVTGDTVKYDDYVRISPEVKSTWRAVDDKLCTSGLAYGQDYTVTLLTGLPGKDGGKLTEDRKVDVALGARVVTTSSARNVPLCLELGADEALDYETRPLERPRGDVACLFDVFGNLRFEAVKRSLQFELATTHEVNNPFGYARQLVRMGNGQVRTAFFFPHDTEAAPWWQGEDARLASLAAAARMAAPLFADDAAFQSALQSYADDQLHWILGRNPFDSSMLMGSGHGNAPYMFFR